MGSDAELLLLYNNACEKFQKGEEVEREAMGFFQVGEKEKACSKWQETLSSYTNASESLKLLIANFYGNPQQGHWQQFLEDLKVRMNTIETYIKNECN